MTERDPNQPTSQPPADRPATDADAPTVAWSPPAYASADHATSTPAEPVRTSGGGRLRWGIALLVTALVVAIGAAAVVLVTGQSTPSALVGYAPADSVAYGELRLDLPGDQRLKLGQFLSKFPGFKDQANLETKTNEVLDRIVLAMTANQQNFSTHISPWFAGQLAFSVSDFPAAPNPAAPSPAAPSPGVDDFRGLILFSVSDTGKARAWLDGVLKDAPTSTADHNGTQVTLVGDGSVRMATAIHAKVMLFGDEASVRAAIDTNGAGPLPKAERFAAALRSVEGESLGYFFMDLDRYLDLLAASGGGTPELQLDEAARALVPDWMMFRLQSRGDALAVDAAWPHVDSPVQSTNRVSELTPHLPPSTILLLDGHDVGDSLLQTIATYRADPDMAEAFKQIDQVAVLFGGFDAILGWIRDAGVAVTRDGDKVDGGLVFNPKDAAGGTRLLATLRSYAVLGGGQAGLQVAVRDVPYAGTTISVLDFGDWRDLAALAGEGVALPFEGRLEVAYAATDDIVVIGLGDSFVKAVLDAKPGASLADDARYRSLVDRVGAQNVGSVYLDLTAVREMAESYFRTANPTEFAKYEQEYKPYLLALDAFVQAGTRDGALDRSSGVLVVKDSP